MCTGCSCNVLKIAKELNAGRSADLKRVADEVEGMTVC